MGNIVDDIRANEDTFADRPFNEVDSLALAQLSYARMPVNVPRLDAEATDVDLAMVGVRDLLRAECYDDMFGKVWSPSMNVDLLRAMCESPRWRDLRVGGYVDEFDPETTKQFSACVFDVGDGSSYVAFRGTDSTIVGWKEDFAMSSGRRAGVRRAVSGRHRGAPGRPAHGRRPFQRRQSGGVCGSKRACRGAGAPYRRVLP